MPYDAKFLNMATVPFFIPDAGFVSPLTEEQEEALFRDDLPKVRYQKNPLEVVVCEVRFPPILRVDTELPSQFQEAVRGNFPLFSESSPLSFAPPEVMKILSAANVVPTSNKTYHFASANQEWTVALNRELLSLTCRKYTRWKEFATKLDEPLKALQSIYKPQFYLRVGLRYRDVISRSNLGLQGVPWGELLQPGIVSEFHTPIAPLVAAAWHQVLLKLRKGNTQIVLQHGLQLNPITKENCYVFDTDLSTQSRTEPANVHDTLGYFNKRSWYFFRTFIADRLHNAMQPESI